MTTITRVSTPTLYQKQYDAIYAPQRFSWIEASTKAGKAQPLDALIATPTGWRRMGDLAVGDEVCGPSGASTVRGVYPQGARDVYRVTFSDGAEVECCAEHLWTVLDPRGQQRTVALEDLLRLPPSALRRFAVPVAPCDYEPQEVPVDPYALGLLLGDGSMRGDQLAFSTIDAELRDALSASLPPHHALRYAGRCDYRIVLTAPYQHVPDRLTTRLEQLGLRGHRSEDKFIPRAYLHNSREVRLALLQGLLDTDGGVNKHGQPEFYTSSPRLAEDVRELAESLGASVITRRKATTHLDAYTLVIRHPDAPSLFRLRRKVEAARRRNKTVKRTFRSIELVRRDEVQCIEVSDPSHLYYTNRHVLTHNTQGCLVWQLNAVLTIPGHHWWVAPWHNTAKIAFERAKDMLRIAGLIERLKLRINHTERTITFPEQRSVWAFKSAEKPDALYGDDVHTSVLDEASRMREAAYTAIYSTLTATHGRARIIGNVTGRGNWFYKGSVAAKTGDKPEHVHHMLTAYDAVEAGVISAEVVAQAKEDLSDADFKMLYLAQAADDGGNPFGLDAIDLATLPGLAAGEPVVWGWDVAKKRDWTVGVGLNRSGDPCRFVRFNKVPYPEIERRIAEHTDAPGYIDATGVGDPTYDHVVALRPELEGVLHPFIFSGNSKQQLMRGLASDIQGGRVGILDGVMKLELEQFEYVMTRTGVKYGAPEGAVTHDDCVCALALAAKAFHDFDPAVREANEATVAREVELLRQTIDNPRGNSRRITSF